MNGEPKQLLEFRGKTFLRHAAEIAVAANFHSIVVVLGANCEILRKKIEDLPVRIAINENWSSGMSSSIKIGLSELVKKETLDAVVIMLCDQPLVTTETLLNLCDVFARTEKLKDAAGANISNARFALTEIASNQTREIVTDADGVFIFTNQKPGIYRVVYTANGFSRLVRENVTLTTGERIRLDEILTVAGVQTIVTVSSDAPLLRSETSGLGQVIDNRKVVDLPINGRSFLSLVGLSPGVAQPPRTSEGASLPRINGGRPRVNEYLFDGVSVLQPEPGQAAFFPVIDAIAEFKVEINNPPAEFGRFNGGVINLTTKAGTNDFRGSIFEFFRNEKLNARNL